MNFAGSVAFMSGMLITIMVFLISGMAMIDLIHW